MEWFVLRVPRSQVVKVSDHWSEGDGFSTHWGTQCIFLPRVSVDLNIYFFVKHPVAFFFVIKIKSAKTYYSGYELTHCDLALFTAHLLKRDWPAVGNNYILGVHKNLLKWSGLLSESPVAKWLKYLTTDRKVMGSAPTGGLSVFFYPVLVSIWIYIFFV